MASETATQDIRRDNLRRLIKERFDNNRAEFSRTADIQPNQINLMLMPTGSKHQRPFTESTARKLEHNLSLPDGWFDRTTRNSAPEGLILIEAGKVPLNTESVLAVSTDVGGIYVTEGWCQRQRLTRTDRLFLYEVACDGMAPEVTPGDQIVVEWLNAEEDAAKNFTRDGCYILLTRTGAVFRHLRRTLSGYVTSSPNTLYSPEERKDLRGIQLQARMVCKLTLS